MDTEQFASELPLSSGCTVVKTDECGLIAIDKKAGRATHPNPNPSPNAKPSMLRARYNFSGEYYSWEAEDGQKRRLYLINRLDSPTSGIVLAADNERVAQLARAEFKNKTAQKTYMDRQAPPSTRRGLRAHVRRFQRNARAHRLCRRTP